MLIKDSFIYAEPGNYLEVIHERWTLRCLKACTDEAAVVFEHSLGSYTVTDTELVFESGISFPIPAAQQTVASLQQLWCTNLFTPYEMLIMVIEDLEVKKFILSYLNWFKALAKNVKKD